jgi:hypothetical protein
MDSKGVGFFLPCYCNNISTPDIVSNKLKKKNLSPCKGSQTNPADLQIVWLALYDDILMLRTDPTVAQLLPL